MFRTRCLIAVVVSCGFLPLSASAQNFTANGVKIRYLDEGKGDAVVLVHGLFADTFWNWQINGVVKDLSKDHRVISIDLPGHGIFSDRPLNKEAYGEQYVDDVALLLDHLKLKKAHLVGYSMGGMITMKFMVKH